MERLRQSLATIRTHLGALGPTQKLLIGSLAIILVMALFLVSQYARTPSMVELVPTGSSEDQQRAITVLAGADLGVKDVGGRAMVPTENRLAAWSRLSESGQGPASTALMFENLISKQSWMNSDKVNDAMYKRALENELGAIISGYHGIRDAKVILDIPAATGFGAAAPRPKASITLFSDTGGAVDQKTVDAAARFVAGAVSRLALDQVTVSDATIGAARAVTDDTRMMASTYREASAAMEHEFRDRIYNLLSDIEGVVVEVTADVDVRRIRGQENFNLPVKAGSLALIASEQATTATESTGTRSAEPGLRSNTGADINAGAAGAGAPASETSETRTEYENHVGTKVSQIDDPRGNALSLVATVSVPRGYIRTLIEHEKEEAGAPAAAGSATPPTEAELKARFDAEKTRIEEAVRPHLTARTADGTAVPGQVVVVMSTGLAAAGLGGGSSGAGSLGGGGGGGVGTILALGGGMIDKAILGALALVAVGMMLLMVKKAGKRTELPTAEELVGLPPALNTRSDLVGEADETDTPIEGIEVNEDEMKAGKLREQVSDLIKSSPDVAGRLLNRWVTTED
ncbi:MAG: hypothetical protein IT437_08255 [Phycisphaerales bacterium]|nr:hypothetical protein [Phycisphaerales bacterium]